MLYCVEWKFSDRHFPLINGVSEYLYLPVANVAKRGKVANLWNEGKWLKPWWSGQRMFGRIWRSMMALEWEMEAPIKE